MRIQSHIEDLTESSLACSARHQTGTGYRDISLSMSPLKFDVHTSSSEFAAARLGKLSILKTDQHGADQTAMKRVIETPGCFMNSIKGSVPHLTPDNMRLQDYGGISVFLEQILYVQEYSVVFVSSRLCVRTIRPSNLTVLLSVASM